MEFKHINGPVYCRYASTPPIVNSALAEKYGIEAHSFVELEEGKNVKASILLEDRSKRMTCHAKVAWVKRDESAGGAFDERWIVGLAPLSLTEEEFRLLLESFTDAPECPLELRDRIRSDDDKSTPVTFPKGAGPKRIKAVTLPVALIDEIDAKRGDKPFSELVTAAVAEYLENRHQG